MRKTVVILLAMLMICTCLACAEESAFTFRNGLHWGMSPADVEAAEGQAFSSSYTDLGLALGILDSTFGSRFESTLGFIFLDDRLIALSAIPDLWVEDDQEDIAFLIQELSVLYGAADENLPRPQPIQNLLAMNGYQIIAAWQPDMITYIAVMVSPESYIEIGYFDINYDLTQDIRLGEKTDGPGL